MRKPLKTVVSAAVLGVMAAGSVQAAGFSLYTEGNGYSTGNFGAGVAAEAADASTGWYNPAGLALIRDQQLVFGGVGVFPTSAISGTSTFRTTPPIPNYVQTFTDLDGGQNALVPSLHYALPLGENATFGLSFVSPYGLSTHWDTTSPVRYEATFTELLTFNVSPEIGGRLSEHFALGGGLDFQYARVKFNRILGAPNIFSLIPPFDPMTVDSLSYNKGDSFGMGFHAGVMGLFNNNHTRLGLNYQSVMRHVFHGYSRLTGVLANNNFNLFGPLPASGTFVNNGLSSNPIELPDVVTLSAYHDLNEKLALLGSVVYTGWSSLKDIQLNNVAAPAISSLGNVQLVAVNSLSAQNYSDVWRFALGANYKVNPQWLLRVGGGYDKTPTNDIDRDIRLPDASRWALSVGAHYQMRQNVGLDFGYTHLFPADNPTVNRIDALGATSSYAINATGEAHAELLGAQLVWTMDNEKAASNK